ncbi:LytR/AlgR family response regulator transcription factor [Enterococcus larvae]|uniref:LytR/AlgR family response regulator transcription factor n=1 Tax=Enterococcus larvae TaxID=2794352 RepID=UPI003F32F4FA
MYRIAICDDEQEFRNILIEKIELLNMVTTNIEFVQFSSGEELLSSNQKFDLLFLDIQMSGMDGNETARIFRNKDNMCLLVFCTGFQQPLTDNFKVRPFRYIMKDMYYRELFKELPDILNEMIVTRRQRYIVITKDGEVNRILLDSILYLTVDGRRTKVVCIMSGETVHIFCREKLKELYNELKQECFEFAHTSYLVNMKRIIHVNKNMITLENHDKVYISRTKSKKFNSRFTQFLNRKFRREYGD